MGHCPILAFKGFFASTATRCGKLVSCGDELTAHRGPSTGLFCFHAAKLD